MKRMLLVALVAMFPVVACAGDADVDDDAMDDATEMTTGAPDVAMEPTAPTPGMYTLSDVEGGFADDMQPGDAYELNLREDGSWSVTANGAPYGSGTYLRTGDEVLVAYETGPCEGTEARFRSEITETSISQTRLEAACDDVPESLVWTWVGEHAEDGAGEM